MTNYYKPLTIGRRHRDLNWINSLVTVHDLQCQCDQPLNHTVIAIFNQEPNLKFNKEDSTLIQKCLTTGDHTGGDVVEEFGGDELETLFADDVFGEDKDAG